MAQPGHRKVFFAWQSDTRAEFNKDLIWDALQTACKELSDDAELGPEREQLGADRDTQGVAGSGDVHQIIFEKLAKTDLAIFDLSAVAKTDGGKAVPNPNVMLELGFATRAITEARIALIANEAVKYDGPLPFDLRNRRTIFYRCSKTEHVAEAKAKLVETLRDALRDMSLAMPEPELAEMAAIRAVREGRPDSRSLARAESARLTDGMLSCLPDKRLLDLEQVKEVLRKAQDYVTELVATGASWGW